MIKIWGIKNCNSVKKALQFLERNKLDYVFIDYKKTPPLIEVLQEWIEKRGIEVVFNTKSATYKSLNLKEKTLNLQEKITLMQEYPTLIKRPVMQTEERLEFGFDEKVYKNLL